MNPGLRVPNTYWKLVYNTDANEVRDIKGYDFDPPQEFDHLRLISGMQFDGVLPEKVKLRLEQSDKPISDYPGNALGLPIVSERLLNHIFPFIKTSVQIIPAPLYEKESDQLVSGYFIINVLDVVVCVDVERSTPWLEGNRIRGFYYVYIDPKRVTGQHMFRYIVPPAEVAFSIICSFDLVRSLEGKGFKGLAFLPCIGK